VEASENSGTPVQARCAADPGAGCFCGSGDCDEQAIVDAEHTGQTGRAAYGDLGGYLGGAVVAGMAGA